MDILLKQDNYARHSDKRVNAQLCNLLEKLESHPGIAYCALIQEKTGSSFDCFILQAKKIYGSHLGDTILLCKSIDNLHRWLK